MARPTKFDLKALNKTLGTTFIYVTHDQDEALTMSDRIAVMSNARIAQVGTPAEIYETPRTPFVAKFIGESNFFDGTCTGPAPAGGSLVAGEGAAFVVPTHPRVAAGNSVRIAVRPEWLAVHRPHAVPAGHNALPGTLRDVIYLGETLHLLVKVGGAGAARTVTVAVRNGGQLHQPVPFAAGDDVVVAWEPSHCQVLEADA